MARISTYDNDKSIQDEDLLAGSNFIGYKEYITKNFKLIDLAEYFANFWIQDGALYNFASLSQSISTSVTATETSAAYSLNLASQFGTFDSLGNLVTLSSAFANQVMTVTTNARFAESTYAENLASTFGTFDADGNLTSLSEAFANNVITTTASNRFATSSSVTSLTSTVSGKPDIFRQDDAPSVSKPVGSIWYDTNDGNKVYVLIAGTPNVWTLTADDRIVTNSTSISNVTQSVTTLSNSLGAEASLIDELQTQFTFDTNGGITGTADALATSITTASSTAAGAVATDLDKLETQFTFDSNGDVSGVANALNTSINTASSTAAGAVASDLDKLETQFTFDANGDVSGVADALNTSISTASSSAAGAVATDLNKLEAVFSQDSNGDVTGITGVLSTAVTSNATSAIANASLATAQSVTDLTSTVDGNTSSITTNESTIATVEGYVESRYSLELDANGSFAGMSILASDGTTSDPFSEIRFVADSFKIYNGGQADLTGSYDAPFEVVGGVVKIKSASIGTVSFGDLSNVPTTFVSTVIYADDSSGTNASTTKGSGQNFFAIKQSSTAWADGDSVTGLVFSQMTGNTGATGAAGSNGTNGTNGAQGPEGPQGAQGVQGTNGTNGSDGANGADGADGANGTDGADGSDGDDGKRTFAGILWYYQGQSSTPTAPSNITAGFRFSDARFNSTSANTLPTNWVYESPLMHAGTASNQYWTIAYTAIESTAGSGYGDVTFASAAVRAFAFNQVVTFNSLSTSGSTTINGSNITTGQIQSGNYGSVSGDYSTAGSIINLTNGNIYTPKFSVIGGNAKFKGDLEGAGGTFSGNLAVNGAAVIGGTATGNDINGRPTALLLKNLGTVSSDAGSVCLEMRSAARWHHVIQMNGYTNPDTNAFDLSAEYRLGKSCETSNCGDNYSKVKMFLNGGGLIIPDVAENAPSNYDPAVSGADFEYGTNIFFNSNNASTSNYNYGRMHLNEYYNTFFMDVPGGASHSSGSTTYDNMSWVMRKRKNTAGAGQTSGTWYSSAIMKVDTNEYLHVKRVVDIDSTAHYLDPGDTGVSIKVGGDIVAYSSSDKRLKNNIKPIENALEKVNKISGVTFEWNEESHKETGKKDIGVIAQEIEEILPEIVDNRSSGYKAVDYPKLTALLIEAVKDLSNQVKELKDGVTN